MRPPITARAFEDLVRRGEFAPLRSARVTGAVHLAGVRFPFPVVLEEVGFEGEVNSRTVFSKPP